MINEEDQREAIDLVKAFGMTVSVKKFLESLLQSDPGVQIWISDE